MDILKKCSRCKATKYFDAFHRNNGVGNGYRSRCKQCEREIKAARDFDIDVVEPSLHANQPVVQVTAAAVKNFDTVQAAIAKLAVKTLRRYLIIPDTHAPYHDPIAFAVMLKAAEALKPDGIVILGDFADFYCVSSFDKHPSRAGHLADELQEVNACLSLVDALGATEKIFIAGNHEDRLDRYIASHAPQLHGLVSIKESLKLDERGWKYVPYKQSVQVGAIWFTHDTGRAGRYSAYQSMTDVGDNAVIGHTHRLSYVVEGDARGKAHVGASFGWLGDFKAVDYMHSVRALRDWAHGFGVGYMEPDGTMHLRPIPIVNQKCVIDGKLISLAP